MLLPKYRSQHALCYMTQTAAGEQDPNTGVLWLTIPNMQNSELSSDPGINRASGVEVPINVLVQHCRFSSVTYQDKVVQVSLCLVNQMM